MAGKHAMPKQSLAEKIWWWRSRLRYKRQAAVIRAVLRWRAKR